MLEMVESGLVPVANPSTVFLSERGGAADVSAAVTVAMEGSHPMLLEVQVANNATLAGRSIVATPPDHAFSNGVCFVCAFS